MPNGDWDYVIDDDEDVRLSVHTLINCMGLECRSFSGVDAFLESFGELDPGCILTDLRMPRRTGLDLQSELLRQGVSWPLIFMTGHGEVPTIVSAIRRGAIDFIEKPFDDERLLEALHAGFVYLRARVQVPAPVSPSKQFVA